jgi:hypothetical protein
MYIGCKFCFLRLLIWVTGSRGNKITNAFVIDQAFVLGHLVVPMTTHQYDLVVVTVQLADDFLGISPFS